MVPESGMMSPLMRRRSVLLPQPLGPMSAVVLPSWIWVETSSMAVSSGAFRSWNRFVTELRAITVCCLRVAFGLVFSPGRGRWDGFVGRGVFGLGIKGGSARGCRGAGMWCADRGCFAVRRLFDDEVECQ